MHIMFICEPYAKIDIQEYNGIISGHKFIFVCKVIHVKMLRTCGTSHFAKLTIVL